jgi:hypothetical protein
MQIYKRGGLSQFPIHSFSSLTNAELKLGIFSAIFSEGGNACSGDNRHSFCGEAAQPARS